MSTYIPFMMKQALECEENSTAPTPLQGHIETDITIVGGGYTGLWTAIYLKEEKPELRICVIEQKLCGHGASGCNGGCVVTLSTKYTTMKKFFGSAEAKRLVLESEHAVTELKTFTEKHNIDCGLAIDGVQYIATNQAQTGAMDNVLKQLDGSQINTWKKVNLDEAKRYAGTDNMLEGHRSPHAGSLQPALLNRGLARAAREMGIDIYENTPMTTIDTQSKPVIVNTPEGSIKSGKVVLAINAWMARHFRQFNRTIAVVSSDMCVTKPCPEKLDAMGLTHGGTVCDSRIFIHYYHRTHDGRLMIGKGGNTFAFGGRILKSFFEPSVYKQQLRKAINRFFPTLEDVDIEDAWNGASDRSVTGFPFFGHLNKHPDIVYGFGYSGNGVTQCLLGGKILRSMVLEYDDEWSRCGFVGGPRGKFPIEPIRWIGSIMIRNGIRRKESAEDAGKEPSFIDIWFSGFAKAFSRADK